jgi:hypothetical protein
MTLSITMLMGDSMLLLVCLICLLFKNGYDKIEMLMLLKYHDLLGIAIRKSFRATEFGHFLKFFLKTLSIKFKIL